MKSVIYGNEPAVVDSDKFSEISLDGTSEAESYQPPKEYSPLQSLENEDREESTFNPLSQGSALKASLSQLPGVASSVFSSFSSILKGTSASPQASGEQQFASPILNNPPVPDQPLPSFENLYIGQAAATDIPIAPPTFYSPTEAPSLTSGPTLPPPTTQSANSFRLKERKKTYAPVPGLNAGAQIRPPTPSGIYGGQNYPVAPSASATPPIAHTEPLESKPNSSFSLTSLFPNPLPLLDKLQGSGDKESRPEQFNTSQETHPSYNSFDQQHLQQTQPNPINFFTPPAPQSQNPVQPVASPSSFFSPPPTVPPPNTFSTQSSNYQFFNPTAPTLTPSVSPGLQQLQKSSQLPSSQQNFPPIQNAPPFSTTFIPTPTQITETNQAFNQQQVTVNPALIQPVLQENPPEPASSLFPPTAVVPTSVPISIGFAAPPVQNPTITNSSTPAAQAPPLTVPPPNAGPSNYRLQGRPSFRKPASTLPVSNPLAPTNFFNPYPTAQPVSLPQQPPTTQSTTTLFNPYAANESVSQVPVAEAPHSALLAQLPADPAVSAPQPFQPTSSQSNPPSTNTSTTAKQSIGFFNPSEQSQSLPSQWPLANELDTSTTSTSAGQSFGIFSPTPQARLTPQPTLGVYNLPPPTEHQPPVSVFNSCSATQQLLENKTSTDPVQKPITPIPTEEIGSFLGEQVVKQIGDEAQDLAAQQANPIPDSIGTVAAVFNQTPFLGGQILSEPPLAVIETSKAPASSEDVQNTPAQRHSGSIGTPVSINNNLNASILQSHENLNTVLLAPKTGDLSPIATSAPDLNISASNVFNVNAFEVQPVNASPSQSLISNFFSAPAVAENSSIFLPPPTAAGPPKASDFDDSFNPFRRSSHHSSITAHTAPNLLQSVAEPPNSSLLSNLFTPSLEPANRPPSTGITSFFAPTSVESPAASAQQFESFATSAPDGGNNSNNHNWFNQLGNSNNTQNDNNDNNQNKLETESPPTNRSDEQQIQAVPASFFDANQNAAKNSDIQLQNFFNNPPPLTEIQQQDSNFNIIGNNLVNKRLATVATAANASIDPAETLSASSNVVEPPSSAQSEFSEYAELAADSSLWNRTETSFVNNNNSNKVI